MDPLAPATDAAPRGSGLGLPFLPTLATAVIVAGFSLLCREPAAVPAAPAAPAAVDARAFAAAGDTARPHGAAAAAPRAPASIAFGRFPLAPEAFAAPVIVVAPAPRIAAVPAPRRACPGPRCGEAHRPVVAAQAPEPPRTDPFASRAGTQTADEEGVLPDFALPFAPATRALSEAAALVRTGATALRGSVAIAMDGLR
ncbi:hypothetical protein [Methylobacterium sp. A54F]